MFSHRLNTTAPVLWGEIGRLERTGINLETFDAYLNEMKLKYSPGTPINSSKYLTLNGSLQGDMYLEIPISNQNNPNIDILRYINKAKEKSITIIFKAE